VTVRKSDTSNTKNIKNIRRKYFLYFDIISYNPFKRFEEKNNNNNLLLPPLLSDFKKGLKKEFNLLEKNLEKLNPNVVALVNILIGMNLRINYVKKKSNYIKLSEFEGIEVEDFNK